MELAAIKSEIKTLADEGRFLRHRIQAAQGPERHALWNEKRALGRMARHSLLSYGYVRGIPYRRLEPRCHHGNEPQPWALARTLERLGLSPEEAAPARLEHWIGTPAEQPPAAGTSLAETTNME